MSRAVDVSSQVASDRLTSATLGCFLHFYSVSG